MRNGSTDFYANVGSQCRDRIPVPTLNIDALAIHMSMFRVTPVAEMETASGFTPYHGELPTGRCQDAGSLHLT